MCGIFCSIIHNQNTFLNDIAKKGNLSQSNSVYAACAENLLKRGPDYCSEINVDVSAFTLLQFSASVLWTQGNNVSPQPLVDADGNVLLWNGDVFDGLLVGDGNDTDRVSAKLEETLRAGGDAVQVFQNIQGPFAFIYFHRYEKKVYFGRDVLGRHSLLLKRSQRNISISSVGHQAAEFDAEVPAVGFFCFDLSQDESMPLSLRPWSYLSHEAIRLKLISFPESEKIAILEPIQSYINFNRWTDMEPDKEELDMWVVLRQEMSMSQLMDKLNTTDSKTRIRRTMTALLDKPQIVLLVDELLNHLRESVRIRVEKMPDYCRECITERIKKGRSGSDDDEEEAARECCHAKVAVLFSGGLDSAVLALLADAIIDPTHPIDLLNVAFERAKQPPTRSLNGVYSLVQEVTYMVPDRETGLQTLSELKVLSPNRKWNFVEINVTQEELRKEREETICHLINPLDTVLDDSLGCALWFASRGCGVLYASPKTPYCSPARIMLSGMGADEQLGGYMRHRTTLKHKGGWPALEQELCSELMRIAERNLGRDDRVTSSHARQCRMPYLDENLVNYLSSLKPWQRCNPTDGMAPGLGDKLLLRLAAWRLGLRAAANLPKRAMQFGSRIANSKERGHATCQRL